MRKGLIGRKMGMTQVFAEDGSAVPVTVIEVEPSVVIQKKTNETDGYEALQLGYGRVKQRSVNRPLQGIFRKADKGFFSVLKEIRQDTSGFEVGDEIRVDLFKAGDYVDVTGISKGKGFAGGVKRHGFRGGRATHGSMFHRAPGSIGASSDPSRVLPGKRLPGHMGHQRKTVQNIQVVAVRPEENVLLVKGSVPGARRGILLIRQAIKKQKVV
ncbi:MAG TPA: 50S ribosomal protein L3 [Syntrophales bacterium]|nr:50S ribosomal protein L3 [Syntrophales bacterium]HOM06767.1 50S ribosomal protein L3 [Syntrophales bacterium]HON99538.1 50S ribosomal protein L3 [Syntrophales bacterium]HPC00727.1 50S ribosomal protein L3 [Syntrophales bacterium]HPQ06075.1 50S ribosomal protein L3 [Syntrophales bacterium]